MRTITNTFLIAMAATGISMAETFGGIGLSVYADKGAVAVDEVIPGTPAAESGIKANDVIIAVDGESLVGADLETAKSVIRGTVNKPAVITYVNGEKDTLQVTLRRTALTTVTVDSRSGSYKADGKFVALVDVGENELQAVYVGGEASSDVKFVETNEGVDGDIKIIETGKETVSFDLKSAGDVMVSFYGVDGARVARFYVSGAKAGLNTARFDASKLPRGRFNLSVESNGSRSSKSVLLK